MVLPPNPIARLQRGVRPPERALRANSGFTLIEAMLAVAIVGVLATIGVAAYDRYAEKARVYQAAMEIGAMSVQIKQFENDNGVLPTTLADIGAAGKLDPWKNPYVYTDLSAKGSKGAARKDHKLNPINSDFDLFSKGKDGAYKTQVTHKLSLDDVIRANDGKFIGLAKDF